MDGDALGRLAGFASSVRDSTLKRLASVPLEKENWKRHAAAMSFADVAQHLIDADHAYMDALETGFLGKNLGRSGCRIVQNRREYDMLIEELAALNTTRHGFVMSLDEAKLGRHITCDRIGGKTTAEFGTVLYWLLDHEIQHRGMLILCLKQLNGE